MTDPEDVHFWGLWSHWVFLRCSVLVLVALCFVISLLLSCPGLARWGDSLFVHPFSHTSFSSSTFYYSFFHGCNSFCFF